MKLCLFLFFGLIALAHAGYTEADCIRSGFFSENSGGTDDANGMVSGYVRYEYATGGYDTNATYKSCAKNTDRYETVTLLAGKVYTGSTDSSFYGQSMLLTSGLLYNNSPGKVQVYEASAQDMIDGVNSKKRGTKCPTFHAKGYSSYCRDQQKSNRYCVLPASAPGLCAYKFPSYMCNDSCQADGSTYNPKTGQACSSSGGEKMVIFSKNSYVRSGSVEYNYVSAGSPANISSTNRYYRRSSYSSRSAAAYWTTSTTLYGYPIVVNGKVQAYSYAGGYVQYDRTCPTTTIGTIGTINPIGTVALRDTDEIVDSLVNSVEWEDVE